MDIVKYRDLFVHRSDVFALQHSDGHYEPVRRSLADEDIEDHLAGHWSLGTYVIEPCIHVETDMAGGGLLKPNTVKYVVFDLDTYEAGALEFLCDEVARLVLKVHCDDPDARESLLLEDSGGKGYHIWLFLSEPIPAAQARAWAEQVRTAYNEAAQRYELDAWPALEIFPKQDEVHSGGFGNLVKLPLGVHAKTGNRSKFLTCQGWASDVNNVQKLEASLIPQAAVPQSSRTAHVSEGGLRQAPFACIAKIVEDGAPSGCRDNAIFHLAHYCFGTGVMDYEQVLDTCIRANEEFSPPLTQREVAQKVQSAQRTTAAHPSCRADWLKGFCEGGENCYAPWNQSTKSGASGTQTDGDDYLSLTPEQRRLARLGKVGQ